VSPALQVAVAAGACLGLQGALWVVARRIRNWSLVDPGWAACLVLCAGLYAALGAGAPLRRAVVAGLALLWGGRHVLLLLRDRVVGRPEEGRYVELRARWSPSVFLGFFLAQGALAAVLSGPFLLACQDGRPFPQAPIEIAALAVFCAGFLLEAVADARLASWKRDPANRGRTCRSGPWAWSRHPNYFGEFLVWCAFALLASAAPGGAVAWYAPLVLLLLLLFVTGIPPAEAQALRSRGDEYRAYQREVSAFVPWPPRRPRTGAP
jgi:steroid 5-alpha reductase family enzyme